MKKKLKILFVNKFFFLKGGSETVFFKEREFLKKNGFMVIDFSMKHPQNLVSYYSDFFITNTNYKKKNRGLWRTFNTMKNFISNKEAVRNINNLVDRTKPDLAHLHNIYHQLTPSIIPVLKKRGIKVILTLHDYKLICPCYFMIKRRKICNQCKGKHFWWCCLFKRTN